MRFRSALFWCGTLAAGVAAPVAAQDYKPLPRALASMPPAAFAQRVEIVDDPLDSAIVLSTARGFRGGQAMIGAYADDVHLRVRIDRATRRATWEVWHTLINFGARAEIRSITYAAGPEPVTVQPKAIDAWEDLCATGDSSAPCHRYIRVGFEVPEQVIAEIANGYRPGSREPWRVRFDDASGAALIGGIAPAEAAGLLQAASAHARLRTAQPVHTE